MTEQEQYNRMKIAFDDRLKDSIERKHFNHQIFTQETYLNMIAKVEHAKSLKYGKTPSDYACLKKFDILEINGCKRLVVPFFSSTTSSSNQTSSGIRMFVHTDEIFDILHTAHVKTGHRRRAVMSPAVSQFKNITREMIKLYLDICEVCTGKKVSKSYYKEIKTSTLGFIRMPTDNNGYQVLLVHIDMYTQFVQLRPLKNINAEEVTHALIDIFSIFSPPAVLTGPPTVLSFGQKILSDLKSSCPDFKIPSIVKTEPNLELLEKTLTTVTDLLNTWIETNNTEEWSKGVKYVQYLKNSEYIKALGGPAGDAMFKNKWRKIERKRSRKAMEETSVLENDSSEGENTPEQPNEGEGQATSKIIKLGREEEVDESDESIDKIDIVKNELELDTETII